MLENNMKYFRQQTNCTFSMFTFTAFQLYVDYMLIFPFVYSIFYKLLNNIHVRKKDSFLKS